MVRAFIGLLISVVLIGPLALAQAGPIGACKSTTRGGWDLLSPPAFEKGPQALADYAVPFGKFSTIYATNGSLFARTDDAGCTWEQIDVLGDAPRPGADYSSTDTTITKIVIPNEEDVTSTVVLLGEQAGVRTRVLKSADGGRSWSAADSGLPPVGQPIDLTISPQLHQVMYVMLNVSGVEQLYRTKSAGDSWERVDQQVPPNPQPGLPRIDPDEKKVSPGVAAGLLGLEVDPVNPNQLWQWGRGGVFYSTNGGQGTARKETAGDNIGALDVYRQAGSHSRILSASSDTPKIYRSLDSGATWNSFSAPPFVQSIAHGRTEQEFAIATTGGSVLLSPNNMQYIPASPTDGTKIKNISTALFGKSIYLYGMTEDDKIGRLLVPYFKPPPPPEPPVVAPEIPCQDVDPPPEDAGTFTPNDMEIELGPGERKVVTYTLDLLKSPTPLDVYFLTDISGSMTDTIEGVKSAMNDITARLLLNRTSVRFGVGEYRAYTHEPAYNRVLDICPPGQELHNALDQLFADGGAEETQLAALYQTATGEGQDEPLLRAHIDPNQEAHFRENAVKVILHATDEVFSELPPHPTYEEVAAALNAKNIKQVALAIDENEPGGPRSSAGPVPGATRVARDTFTFALTNTDCDGDGDDDIQKGEELVCVIHPDRAGEAGVMAQAIVELLNATEDRGDVRIEEGDDPAGIITGVTNTYFPSVNFKDPAPMQTTVTYFCPPALPEEETFLVEVYGVAQGTRIATAAASVTCTKTPKRQPPLAEDPPPVAPFFALPAIVPPVLRPPETVPGTNPQTQPQPQSQAQAQGAFAAQEEQQTQLAYAANSTRARQLAPEPDRGEYRMSRNGGRTKAYRMSRFAGRKDSANPAPLFLGAAAMSLMFAFASVTRRQIRTQAVRRRR